jgi:hypothetical protein
MKRSREYLEGKMHYHEAKANEYFDKIKTIEDKERLIGFKPKNDQRGSTDGVSVAFSNITTIERYP